MKVTLISPYPDLHAFGIRTLSACLKKEGHNVQVIFLPKPFINRYEDETLSEVIELSKQSDLIGISLMTNFFENAIQITRKLKENLNVPIIWGGIHPTIRPIECLNHTDMVSIGEGEEALPDLLKKMEEERNYHEVENIWFKDKEKIIVNKIRPLIQDLDTIPFPDYGYKGHYVLEGKNIHKMSESLLSRHIGGIYKTITSRGCVFECAYCCNNTLNRMFPLHKRTRKRSIENIIKELTEAKSKLPFINFMWFADDHFFAHTTEELKEFRKKYKENVNLPFHIGGVNPQTLTKEKLSLLVDAGLNRIRMGIQTGSERTKKLYKRYYSNQQVEKSVTIINEFKYKITPVYDIILDNPFETENDLIETLMFLVRLPTPYRLSLFTLTFYPETDMYKMAKKNGIITDDLKDVYNKDFRACKKTYLNRLFFLLGLYASNGNRIPITTMSLLTSKKIRQLKLNCLLYAFLRFRGTFFEWHKYMYLLHEGMKDIQKKDLSRIRRWVSFK